MTDPIPFPKPLIEAGPIDSIVFDLDGTLYQAPSLARAIEEASEKLVAATRGITLSEGQSLLSRARARLAEELEMEPTLTQTCQRMGIEIQELHAAFERDIVPEDHLEEDLLVQALLESLQDRCNLYIYTNNNLNLSRRILACLGIEGLFTKLYTIEYAWAPKPDAEALRSVIADIGGELESFLFVGDRRQVDLLLPASWGIPTLLVRDTSQLVQIHKVLGLIP